MKKLINAISIILVTVMILINPIQAEAVGTESLPLEFKYSDLVEDAIYVNGFNFDDLIRYSDECIDYLLCFDVRVASIHFDDNGDKYYYCEVIDIYNVYDEYGNWEDLEFRGSSRYIYVNTSPVDIEITDLADWEKDYMIPYKIIKEDRLRVYGRYLGTYYNYSGTEIPTIELYLPLFLTMVVGG